MANYGHSVGSKTAGPQTVTRMPLWDGTCEFYPAGAYLAVDSTYTEGSVVYAGTPATIDKVGGTVTLGGDAPNALTYDDVTMGPAGATLTLVIRGTILESRSSITYTDAQRTALKGSITFIKEA